MNRRPAVTLVEVLIAIFVMALGLMSILALFPVAAVQMAQALKDQRSAEAAANAAAWFRMAWKDACEQRGQNQPDPRQRFVIALSEPKKDDREVVNTGYGFAQIDVDQNLGPPDTSVSLPPITSNLFSSGAVTPSYPVYVDPVGWQSAQTPALRWSVAGNTVPRRPFFVRRQVPDFFENLNNPLQPSNRFQRVLRQFSLLDDITFRSDGTAQTTGGQVDRQGRYSWAYMVRRPNNLIARQIGLTIVVYSGRSIDVPSLETSYPGSVVDPTNPTAITLPWSVTKPAVRRGWWLLDATMTPVPQGFFYRVVNVNDDTPGQLRIEVQTSVRAIPGNPPRLFVVMDNVVEVFEKGTIDPKEEIRPF